MHPFTLALNWVCSFCMVEFVHLPLNNSFYFLFHLYTTTTTSVAVTFLVLQQRRWAGD